MSAGEEKGSFPSIALLNVRSMKHALFTATLALVGMLHAQDPAPALAPELAPLAAKYEADSKALNMQKEAAITRAAQPYSAALDAAEKSEITAGRVAAIAAITAERDALKKGDVKPEFPSDLPKGLSTARKNCLDGFTRVGADFQQRQQRIIADYVRILATLQARPGGNAALTIQINEEKVRVLKAAPPGDSPLARLAGSWVITYAGGQVRHYSISTNGTLTQTDENPQRTAKVTADGSHYLIDFNDGKIERMKIVAPSLQIEHFDPKEKLADGKPPVRATGKRAK